MATTTTAAEESELGSTQLLSVAAPAMVVLTIMYLCFCCCRRKNPDVYEPRCSHAITEFEQSSDPPRGGCMGWLMTVLSLKIEDLAENAGVDAAARVIFHLTMVRIFFLLTVICCGALIPIFFILGDEGGKDIAQFTMSNTKKDWHFWCISGICCLASLVIYVLIFMGLKRVAKLRDLEDKRLCLYQHMTVLLRKVPKDSRSEDAIQEKFEAKFPDEVSYVKLVRNLGSKHEKNVVKYVKYWRKMEKAKWKNEQDFKKKQMAKESLCSEKVDAVELYNDRCHRYRNEIEYRVQHCDEVNPSSYAFVAFKSFTVAARVLAAKTWGATPAPHPREIIWPRMWKGRSWAMRTFLSILMALIVVFIIIIFIPFTAFAISIANLESLAENYDFLSWVMEIPKDVLDIIQGLLPVIVVAVINALVVPILGLLASFAGVDNVKAMHIKLMWYYFWFLTFDSFVVVIIGGSLFDELKSIIDAVKDTDFTIIKNLLGGSVPKVSTFFICFVTGSALGGAPGKIANLGKLIGSKVILKCLAKTEYEKEEAINPGYCQYAIFYGLDLYVFLLSASYATVAPLMTAFALVYFVLNYVSSKYNLNYVWRSEYRGGGMMVVSAFRATFIGVFIGQLVVLCVLYLHDDLAWIPVAPFAFISFILAIALPCCGPGKRIQRQQLPMQLAEELQQNSHDTYEKLQTAAVDQLWLQPSFSVNFDDPLPWKRFYWAPMFGI